MRLSARAAIRAVFTPFAFFLWLVTAVLMIAEPAQAIPVFARKYQTACATCHAGFPKLNGVGLAFKMNGYRFSREDEDKVKQPPLQLGNDSYRDIFPNSILPSTIPMMPPIAFELQQQMTTNLANAKSVPAPGPSPDFNFPTQVNILSAGTITDKISFWTNGGLDGNFNPFVERAFLTANNLFAPDDEEDENGMHLAPGWLILPKHFLNLKVGQFDPFVIAPYAATYRSVTITSRLPSAVTVGSSGFSFEPQLRGIEAYGHYRNYTSWCFGVVDGAALSAPTDNNSHKDMYTRIGHKWWGFPLDGEVVTPKKPKPKSQEEDVRGQSPDNTDLEEDDPTPWLDYYRQTQFETGIFGYLGRNDVSPLNNPFLFTSGTLPIINQDNFNRVGFDFQWQHQDLHILGTYIYGQDRNPGTGFGVNFNTWFVEANYYFKPWIIGYARYEELQFMQPGLTVNNIQRAVPGVAFYPILNLAIRSEFVIDTSGKGTTPNQFLIMADYAF